MKVLAVIIGHPLRKVAGATNAGRELSVAVADLVDTNLAIMWDEDESFTIGNLKVRHLRSTNPLTFLASWLPRSVLIPFYRSRIPELIRRGDYDLVHVHNLLPTFAAEDVARACLESGIPYVISSHGFNELSRYAEVNGFGKLKSILAHIAITRPFRRMVRNAAAIFALSDREGELLNSIGVDSDRVHVVTNGVSDFYLQSPPEADLSKARAQFRIGRDPVLLFMGSLHRYKGLDVFLRALRDLQPPFQAVVAGQFKSENERLSLLEDARIDARLGSEIVFTGRVSDVELRALYHLADIFVYPTLADTLPLVVLEAMACGLPIISTTVGGIPFAVGEEQGILLPPNDVTAVSRAVNLLLADPQRRERMGRSAEARVRQTFRWSDSANRAVEGYCTVLNTRRRGAPKIAETGLRGA